ncbi:MAG: M28 family peptidase, partial [FCB group bacterium]|nr:M28 family peptidase [FCB group bacterium]
RVTGTDSCDAARDWIAARFASLGYDSIFIDTFQIPTSGDGYNVVVTKIGTRYPNRQIIIGGHFDAVLNSPGADDNGSGTTGVIEIARVLKNIETEMTIIFIAFDSEEIGLYGASHYASEAAARSDDIQYMLNMDMIAHQANDSIANLFYGPEIAYSQLWGQLAQQYVGITGILAGASGSSDHAPFIQHGYPATFVHEYIRSTHYHSSSDSTAYFNFDYMTRMIKASLATAFAVNLSLPIVRIDSVLDGGDGQSLKVTWSALDPMQIDYYYLYWTTIPATQPDSVLVSKDSANYIVDNLTTGQLYSFYLIAFDSEGRSSISFEQKTGTPNLYPAQPSYLAAVPIQNGVKLWWPKENTELDFEHFTLVRDGIDLAAYILDSTYIDNDPSLGSDLHNYYVRSIDTGGLMSDTTGVGAISSKAATLQAGRILALNRSGKNSTAQVEETVTGEFMRDALTGLNFDYYSDTAHSATEGVRLFDMVDYSLMIIGAEGGRQNDIAGDPMFGGIMDTVAYYLSLGGKVIIFGRWGELTTIPKVDTVYFTPGSYDFGFTEYFNIGFRIRPWTLIDASGLTSDLYGAHSQIIDYPNLVWDSLATLNHSQPFDVPTGIPFPSFPVLAGAPVEIIYTYDSHNDSALTEGKPIAWRYTGGEFEYVFFELPLSFMERDGAVAALRQAVSDMGIATAVEEFADGNQLPATFALAQNYPNPFNPNTTIEFYNPQSTPTKVTLEIFNILGQKVITLLDGPASPGINSIDWDGLNGDGQSIATGIYFYRLQTETTSLTRRMILLK